MKPKSVGRVDGSDPLSHPVNLSKPKAGFVAGTVLYTREGEVPVEFLSPSDMLITRNAGFARLTRIHRRRCVSRAISFAAGSLGHTRPDQDLILPGAQLVLIRDWRAKALFGTDQALVRADALVDDEFIRDLGPQKMHLHQLEFDAPHVIYVGGVELSCMSRGAQTINLAA